MKKSLLSLSLVTLVTGTFLSSCSGVVKYEDGVIVKIGDTKYTIEEAYKEFSGYKEKDSDSNYTISEEGAKNYYTLLKNILIQLAVPTTNAIEKYVDQKLKMSTIKLLKIIARAMVLLKMKKEKNLKQSRC